MVHRRLALSATAAALLLPLAACDKAPLGGGSPAFKAIDITGADYAQGFDLPDAATGQRRRLADFAGKVVVVFFGFTHCPDVCPTTLLELAAAKKQLGADGERVQGVFITVDPERDTPELLKAYVENFGAGFVAVRGTPEETAALAKSFKVFYAKSPGKSADTYSVDHTAASFVFDTKGKVRLYTRYGSGSEALVHDLRLLLAQG